ncbi:MAG: peptidoglycan D,D-transpeptidase FtsI family protein [Alphaproteobacteria bacterium]
MIRKLYSQKGRKEDFYTLGQEIKIDRNRGFKPYGFEKDSLGMCKNRVILAVSLFCLAFVIISIRVFSLCVLSNLGKDTYVTREASGENLQAVFKSPIKRADIVDRNGSIIATSLPTVNLFANPKKMIDVENAAMSVHEVFPDLSYESLLKKFKSKSTFVYLRRNLTPSQQVQVNNLGIPGLDFENGEKRIYPHEALFAHIIGKTNIDNEGISGIEKELDERLTESDIPLQLTIDAGVQYTIREELLKGVEKFKANGGVAILMDVKTSEIVSMVSLPDFDPNKNISPDAKEMFSFATKGVYEPGSVFKVFNTALGLESGKIKMTDKFDATKPLKLGRSTIIKDYRGENRWLSVQEVLVYSSNIGSVQMVLKVGKTEQKNFLQKLGFFEAIDVDVAEKAVPMVPKRWQEDTMATVAYGYGISVTPLHIITAFSSIVNGGVYNYPSVVKKDHKEEGYRVVSKATSKNMRQLLRNVVIDGSGKRANIVGYEVAGKTGTANKLTNGKYVDKKVMTTFVSTFPASDPKYALYVMLDEPKPLKETWGFVTSGWNTVPTTRDIIAAIAPQLNIKANYDLDEVRKTRIIEASY